MLIEITTKKMGDVTVPGCYRFTLPSITIILEDRRGRLLDDGFRSFWNC